MEKKTVLVMAFVVGLIGLLSVVTGFAAEGTRIKADKVGYIISTDTCVYPKSPSMGLGVTSALTLLVAQLILSISSGCICCIQGPRPSGSKWIISVVCFVISWITFVIAFILLLVGASLNSRHGEHSSDSNESLCTIGKPGIFAGATVLSIVTLVLGMLYFFMMNSDRSSTLPQANIAMGQPQYPPQQKTSHQGFAH